MKNILTSHKHAAYRQVLEVVGLRTTPLSRGQIFDEWHNIHSPKPNERKNYIYDVVKYLYVEGYLAFLLDKKSQDSESLNSNIRVVTIEGEIPWNKEEKATYVKSDSSWRYQLTLKGLLFYLISTICHNETTKEERKKLAQHKIVKTKTINEVIKITSEISNKKQDLRFLNCFQVFDEIYDTKTKVDIILQIARELENLVSERTSEFLRDYVITRCYDEVTIKIADIQKSEMIHNLRHKMRRRFGSPTSEEMEIAEAEKERANYELDRLEQYKEKILYKLIPITKSRLENMMEDLKTTKQGKRKGSKSKQNLNLNPV